MKKEYLTPSVEIIEFTVEEVIADSGMKAFSTDDAAKDNAGAWYWG